MRGTPYDPPYHPASRGIIPAYAGNTAVDEQTAWLAWDHPRVCGEHVVRRADPFNFHGSSPRMRGTLASTPPTLVRPRIIPAYAGNTLSKASTRLRQRDHPRVCGEHWVNSCCLIIAKGSSPRMRGTQVAGTAVGDAVGIIPAYAGNTSWDLSTRRLSWDHPRVCGEHAAEIQACGGYLGSSPRMRGTHYRSSRHRYHRGIIPAYAGNTRQQPRRYRQNRDHPRVCGEHAFSSVPFSSVPGSSPRMRGTLA